MKKRRFLAALLCYAMVFTSAVPSYAAAADSVITEEEVNAVEVTNLSDDPVISGEDEFTTDSLVEETVLEADDDMLTLDELPDKDIDALEAAGSADGVSGNEADDEDVDSEDEIGRDEAGEPSSCFKVNSDGSLDLIAGYSKLSEYNHERVVIPKEATTISANSKLFKGDTSVKTVQFESGGTGNLVIEAGAFEGSNIETFYAPANYHTVSENTFSSCSSLTFFDFNNISRIEDRAFLGCRKLGSDLNKLGVHNNVNYIGNSAFANTGFTSLGISGLVKIDEASVDVGEQAFAGCTNLSTVTIPKSFKGIPKGCFSDCSNLTSVTLYCSGAIKEDAFKNCTKLKSLELGRVSSIEANAFLNCVALANIVFPDSINGLDGHQIATGAFTGCDGINSLKFEYNNPDDKNRILVLPGAFPDASNVTVRGYIDKLKEYVADVNKTPSKNWKYISIVTNSTIQFTNTVIDNCGVVATVNGKDHALKKTTDKLTVKPGTTVTLTFSQKTATFGIEGGSLTDGEGTVFTFVSYSGYKYKFKFVVPDHDMMIDFKTYPSGAINKNSLGYYVKDSVNHAEFIRDGKDIVIDNGAGKKGQLYITSTYKGVNYNLCEGIFKYKSSNTAVATISETGFVTVLKEGKTTITATCKDNSAISVSFVLFSDGSSPVNEDSLKLVVDGDKPVTTQTEIWVGDKPKMVSVNVVSYEKKDLSTEAKVFNIKLEAKNKKNEDVYVNAKWISGDTSIAKVSYSSNMTNSNKITIPKGASGETYVRAAVKSGSDTYYAYMLIRVIDFTPRVIENTVSLKLSHIAKDEYGGGPVTIAPVSGFELTEDQAKMTDKGGLIHPAVCQYDSAKGRYVEKEGFTIIYVGPTAYGQYKYRLIPTGKGLVQGIGKGTTKEFSGKNKLYICCTKPYKADGESDYFIPINSVKVTNSNPKYNLKMSGKINLRYKAVCYDRNLTLYDHEQELARKDKYETDDDYYARYVKATVGEVKFPNPIPVSEAKLWGVKLVSKEHYNKMVSDHGGKWFYDPDDKFAKNFIVGRKDSKDTDWYIWRSDNDLQKEDNQDVVKGRILYYYKGISEYGNYEDTNYIVKDITIPTTTTAPKFYLSVSSAAESADNTDPEYTFKVMNKATKKVAVTASANSLAKIELDKTKDHTRFLEPTMDPEGVVTLKGKNLPEGKSVAAVNVWRVNWEKPATYNFTVNTTIKVPSVKVSPKTVTLNRNKNNDEADIKISLGQKNTVIIAGDPEYAGRGAAPAISFDKYPAWEGNQNICLIRPRIAAGVTKGTYKYKCKVQYKYQSKTARDLKTVNFTVKVSGTQPSIKLSSKTFTFNFGDSSYKEKEVYKIYTTVKGMAIKKGDTAADWDMPDLGSAYLKPIKVKKGHAEYAQKVMENLNISVEFDADKKKPYLEFTMDDISAMTLGSFSYNYELTGVKVRGAIVKPIKITVKGTTVAPAIKYSSSGKLNTLDPKSFIKYTIKVKNFSQPVVDENVEVLEYDKTQDKMVTSTHFRAERDKKNQLITRLYVKQLAEWNPDTDPNNPDLTKNFENKSYEIQLKYTVNGVPVKTKTFSVKPVQTKPNIKLDPAKLQFVSGFGNRYPQRADVLITKSSVLNSHITDAIISDKNDSMIKDAFVVLYNDHDFDGHIRNALRSSDKTCEAGHIMVWCIQPELLKKGKTYKIKVNLETDGQFCAEVKQKDGTTKWQKVSNKTIEIPVIVNK